MSMVPWTPPVPPRKGDTSWQRIRATPPRSASEPPEPFFPPVWAIVLAGALGWFA